MSSQEQKSNILMTPFNIGNVQIKNRFVMGPMGMEVWQKDEQCGWTDGAVAFFEERAKGGFGAIYTGCQSTDVGVDMFPQATILTYKDHFIETSRKVLDAVHKYDTKMFLELTFGAGRNYPTFKAPSAKQVYNYPNMTSPVITRKEIAIKRDSVIAAAAMGREAGFDGVDIHALHWGYLLDQFVLSITNDRTDEYGGCLDNRLRLLRETVEGIHRECGDDYPVTVGLGVKSFIKALNKASLFGEDEAGRTVEESIEIAKKLEEMGIAAIMCDTGVYDSFYYACPPSYMPKGHGLELYKPIKEAVSIPVIARSRMGDAAICQHALEDGYADAVMLSRPSLADPEFPAKVMAGTPEKIRPCIGCNMGCIGRLLEGTEHVACAVNPRACYEINYPAKHSASPKSIAVVGGGAAGMQACLTAVECGHKVELFEKADHLGGELNAAGAHKDKQDLHDLRDWYIRELKEKNVPVHLSTEFTAEMCDGGKYDVVIMATGASSIMPASIKGIEKAVSAVEMLETGMDVGESVIVVGGGMVGCETAVDLAKKGKKVSLVEQLPAILSSEFVPQQHKGMLKDMIEAYGVEVYEDYKLVEVTDTGAVIEVANKMFTLGKIGEVVSSKKKGDRLTLNADKVVLSIGLKPNPNITKQLTEKGVKVIEIGSAVKAGNVINATHDAYEAVYNLD